MKWHALDEDNTRSGYNSSDQIVTLQQKQDKVTEMLRQIHRQLSHQIEMIFPKV